MIARLATRYLASKVTACAVGAIVGGGMPGLAAGWVAQRYVTPQLVAAVDATRDALRPIDLGRIIY